MKKFSLFTRFILSCAGVDASTMAQCTSTEVSRYKIIGTCVLLPALLGLISGGFAMYLISQNTVIASIFAIFWGWIIFTLDRAVVSGTRLGKFSLGTLGRMLMAVLIAFTVSEPLLIHIFTDAIEEKRIDVIDIRRKNLTADIDQQITNLETRLDDYENKKDQAYTSYEQEVDGTGGSRVPLRGPIAEVKWEKYMAALGEFQTNKTEIDREIVNLEVQKKEIENLVEETSAKGLLGNITVLNQLSKEDSSVKWALWLIRLLFLSIELIPILIKLGYSGRDLYGDIDDLNKEGAFAIQKELIPERMEVMKKEQTIKLIERKNELLSQEIRGIIDHKINDVEYLMDKISHVVEQQIKLKNHIANKVKDDVLRNGLINQLSMIYDSYVEMLEELVSKSKTYYSDIKSETI